MFNKSVSEVKENQAAYEAIMDELGRHLVNLLHATFKVASMYEANNNRYLDQSNKLRAVLQEVFKEDPYFTLTIKGGYMFLSDIRLKADRDSEDAMTYFLERWPALGISGLSFSEKLDPRELDKFIFFMSGYKPEDDSDKNLQAIKERLNGLRIENIIPVGHSRMEEEPEDEDKKRAIRAVSRKTFFSAMAVVHDTMNQAKNHNSVNIAKSKRVVQSLIDIIIQDEAALLEMTTLHNFDDYTYVHSVNVCVLSLVLGYHLGLDRKRLSNMGVGALLHDIGKTKLPIDLLNKPDTYDEFDWELMKKHPIFGIKFIFGTRTADQTTVRASTAVFEHHIAYDGSGYPELLKKRMPSLFARIVSIADTYNAMTSGRIYHNKRNLPDEVVTNMVNRVGKAFDPTLLKMFVNTMGIYPVGTIVTLSSRQIGIIARNNPDDLEKPQVKVIGDESGLLDIEEVKVIDLSKEPGVMITRMIDGDKYKIDTANYLDIG